MQKTKKILAAKVKGAHNKANKMLEKRRGHSRVDLNSSMSEEMRREYEQLQRHSDFFQGVVSRTQTLCAALHSSASAASSVSQLAEQRASSPGLGDSRIAGALDELQESLQRDVVSAVQGFLAGPAEAAQQALANFREAARDLATSEENVQSLRSRSKLDYSEVSTAEAVRDRDQAEVRRLDADCVEHMMNANEAAMQLESIINTRWSVAWAKLQGGTWGDKPAAAAAPPPPVKRLLPPGPAKGFKGGKRKSKGKSYKSSYGGSSYGPPPPARPAKMQQQQMEVAPPPKLKVNPFTQNRIFELDVTEREPSPSTQFSVRCGKQSLNVSIDLEKRLLFVGPYKYSAKSVQQVHKSRRSHCRLVLNIKGCPREKYIFSTPEERERFWELLWSIRGIPTQPSISIHTQTWNMGEARGPSDMGPMFPPGHDMYVIGVQECEFLPHQEYHSVEQDLAGQVERTLGEEYIKVAVKSLLSIRLVCVVHRRYIKHVSNVHLQSVACGIGKVVGNKGGVALSLNFLDTRLCFITGHFAAHMEKADERNQDYKDVISGLKIPDGYNALNYFHAVFIFGDFNYRIEGLERDVVLTYIECGDLELLLPHDQLLKAKANGDAFYGFQEGTVTNFKPSYRWNRDDDQFPDDYSEEKMRVPSWCDRVLWRALPGFNVELRSYGMVSTVRTSDHRPVYAEFTVPLVQPNLPHIGVRSRVILVSSLHLSGCTTSKGDPPEASVRFLAADLLDPDIPPSTRQNAPSMEHSWQDMSLVPLSTNVSHIRTGHLFFEVMHKASSKRGKERLGCASIPLEPAIGKLHQFTVFLQDAKGSYRGQLSGAVQIT